MVSCRDDPFFFRAGHAGGGERDEGATGGGAEAAARGHAAVLRVITGDLSLLEAKEMLHRTEDPATTQG